MRKLSILLFATWIVAFSAVSQENITYKKPPKEILELVDIERAPSVSMDSKKEQMLFFFRNSFKTLDELSEPEIKLGGLRINPQTNISSTTTFSNNIKYKKVGDKALRQIAGLPQNAKITFISFSPDETQLAFTNTTDKGVQLWVADLKTLAARKLSDLMLNANTGFPYTWFKDGSALLVKTIPANAKPLIDTEKELPKGPIVSMSDGQISQNRTYQDLLKNPIDEANFETLMTSEIYKVDLNGSSSLWKDAGMYLDETFSPDGKYLLLTTLAKPFSYVVPYYNFPMNTDIHTSGGKFLMNFNKQPLLENLPKGFMATQEGKRGINWRSDKAATIYWVEALDKGNPEIEVEFRDEVFQLDAPFTSNPESLVKTINRYAGITWGSDRYAILRDRWWNTRNQKTYVFNPSNNKATPRVIWDRNYQDVYSDPGSPQTEKNNLGTYTLRMNGNNVYLFGSGFTAKGQFPFIDELNLETLKTKRIYQSPYTDKVEQLVSLINPKKGTVLTRMESPNEYPNYYIKNIKNKKSQPITSFENPFKSIAGIHKEVINYKREDGVELTGTLYLPVGYDMKKKEKLPMIMWAYPAEYKDKSSAGQSTANPNSFTYLSYGNPIYWVTRGYAVLDDAAFPIVGEGKTEPNDSFIEQLVANAKAAIDAVDKLGYIDRNKVAVGGHSYGAFMTANLLTHSNLFAAGIARSGAYNRTLTPFGFQSEQRSYWEAPEVYDRMSPFMNADKMKTPMLLIHGEVDNNSGTHTMQSERYFQALKSFGAPVRLVILPKESHGYAAKNNVFHLLWEQDQWLEKYVKNR